VAAPGLLSDVSFTSALEAAGLAVGAAGAAGGFATSLPLGSAKGRPHTERE